MNMPKVAVVGGSIAGLTAANLLRDAGCDVDVYERSVRPLSGFGTGIVVQPELVRYLLERAGARIEQISVGSDRMRYIDSSTGDLLGEIVADWRFTAYNAIYRCLLDKFGLDRYHMGYNLTDIEDGDEYATATFENGETIQAPLILCADGGHSVSREKLIGIVPSYAGYVTWRGMVAEGNISPETYDYFKGAFTYGLLPDSHIIAYPVPEVAPDGHVTGRTRLNWQWYWNVAAGPDLDALMADKDGIRRSVTVHSNALPSATLREFHSRAARELTPPFTQLLCAAREPFVTLVSDAECTRMAFKHIALIGDAAFTPRPHAAAGAAKACDDAWSLVGRLLSADGEVASALAAWEPGQIEIGHLYLDKVRAMGAVLQNGGSFPPGAPENRFGLPRPSSPA